MATEVTVHVPDASPAEEARWAARVAAVFESAEQRFSRFRDDSERSRVQRAVGPVEVSREFLSVILRCQEAVRATGGLFDPAVGASMIALGYDRPFAPGALDRAGAAPPVAPPRRTLLEVRVDEPDRTIEVPAGLVLDFGGFVKGDTVDRAAAMLPRDACVDAGGDAWLGGAGPDGEGWIVDVEDPRDAGAVVCSLRVSNVAVATSGGSRRHWSVGDARVHHLVDPRTGLSADTDLAQVTVFTATAAGAEIVAKSAFILGVREARRWISGLKGVSALLVDRAGALYVERAPNGIALQWAQ